MKNWLTAQITLPRWHILVGCIVGVIVGLSAFYAVNAAIQMMISLV